jgi:hypothetical protein
MRDMKRPAIATLLAAAGVLAAATVAQAAFAPGLRLTLDPPRAGDAPSLTATVLQNAGDTAAKRFTILFPRGFAIKAPVGVTACDTAAQARADCPRSSEIGSLEATLADGGKLAGTVHLAEAQSGTGLLVILRGSGELAGQTIPGNAGPRPNGQAAITFDGLPNRTLTTMTVRLIGGDRGLLRAPFACGKQLIEGRLTSHAGELAIGQSAVELTGCTRLSVTRVRISQSRLRAARRAGLTLSWHQAVATSRTRVFVERRDGRRWRRAGSLTASGDAGANSLRFNGRVRGRALRPGVYHFRLVSGGGKPVTSSRFTVLPPL